MAHHNSSQGWRADIQALRGLAVLLVVADHFGIGALRGGFLGVDVFFVVSGFLMTGLIVERLDTGRFTLVDFYARRARRLLPAAYATTVLTAIAGVALLDPLELRNTVLQIAGAFTFTTNVVLWRQVDYFNSDAALKPLLHFWSLAVEEQYYLFIPFLLLWCPRRHRVAVNAALVAVSLALCLYFVSRRPSGVFYFLPFRAWELGLGSVAALLVRRWGMAAFGGAWLRLACTAVLVITPLLATPAGHPGPVALLVCLATAWILMSQGATTAPRALAPARWLGDRSYTLYLVHWPVLALLHNVYVGTPPAASLVAALAAIAVWMELQYRGIEQPFRQLAMTPASVAALVAIPLSTIAATAAWSYAQGDNAIAERAGNVGLSDACDFKGDFVPAPACESRPRPTTLVWGDSFAMHLVPGLAVTLPGGLLQATRTVCGPFLGLAPLDHALRSRAWAEQCIGFNASVVAYLRAHPEIETVVLSSALRQYLPGAEPGRAWSALAATDGTLREVPQDLARLQASLHQTVQTLRAMGRRVVLVAPPPASDFDIGRCHARADAGKFSLDASAGCAVPVADYQRERSAVLGFLAQLRLRGTVDVIGFEPALCDAVACRTRWEGVALYRDAGHFSIAGSREIARRMQLGTLVQKEAR